MVALIYKDIAKVGLYLLGSALFFYGAYGGIRYGRIPSIRGGRISKNDGEAIFWVCVSLYIAIGVFLAVAAFVFT